MSFWNPPSAIRYCKLSPRQIDELNHFGPVLQTSAPFAEWILKILMFKDPDGYSDFVKANVSFQPTPKLDVGDMTDIFTQLPSTSLDVISSLTGSGDVRFTRRDNDRNANAPYLSLNDVQYTMWESMKHIFETADLETLKEAGYKLDGSQYQHEQKDLIYVRAIADSKPVYFFICAKNPEKHVFMCFEDAKPELWVKYSVHRETPRLLDSEGCVSYNRFPQVLRKLGNAPTMVVYNLSPRETRVVELRSSVNVLCIVAEIENGAFLNFHETCLKGLKGSTEDPSLGNVDDLTVVVPPSPWVVGHHNNLPGPHPGRRLITTAPARLIPHNPQLVLSSPYPEPSIPLVHVGAFLTGAILGGILVRYCFRRFMGPKPSQDDSNSAPNSKQDSQTVPGRPA